MPQWMCDWDGCETAAAQRTGDCLLCNRHLCRIHRHEPWHNCPEPEKNWETYSHQYSAAEARDISALYCRIDSAKLCSRASELRGGIPCTAELSLRSLSKMMGNQNCHAEITFEDDTKWLARFRLVRTTSPPQEIRDWILQSEVTTMIYLQQHTCIPTPEVFDWALESDPDNPLGVGIGYILMKKLDGKPIDWQTTEKVHREKVMQQLADIFLELEKHPFTKMGSLAPSKEGTQIVQGLADQSTFKVGEGPLGPFSTSLEGSQAMVESYLEMIASGEIDGNHPVNDYLTHRFRLDIAGHLWGGSPDEKFFLKHPDDKGDHILVNNSFKIVGIIDWEWTRTVSKAEAFCSPCMMWPVAEFYQGSNELAEDEVRLAEIFRERGREDLAGYVTSGRKWQRFFFALGVDSSDLDGEKFANLFAGLRQAVGLENEPWDHFKSKALGKWKDDRLLNALLHPEQDQ